MREKSAVTHHASRFLPTSFPSRPLLVFDTEMIEQTMREMLDEIVNCARMMVKARASPE